MRHRLVFTHTFSDILLLVGSIELVILVAARWNYISDVTWMQTVCLHSGRFSLLLFSALFLAGSGGSNLVTRYLIKPYHAFAWAHGIHLSEVFAYLYLAGLTPNPIRLSGGILAYAMIFVLPLLYDRLKENRLSETFFRRCERIYLYYVWTIFFLTYLVRVRGLIPHAAGSYASHLMGLGYLSLLLGTRLVSLLMTRGRAPGK